MDEGKKKMSMIGRIKGLLKRRGFTIYTRPFELNIVGLRNKNVRHADEIHVFYKINAKNWNYHIYEGITDPFYLSKGKPSSSILLKEGQYADTFEIGRHREKFTALVETKPVVVLENNDRASSLSAGKTKKGNFNIDIIPAAAFKDGDEGCQLLLGDENFTELIVLCKKHAELYGNHFTYSLIDFREAKR
jgi:hypothetical protein